MIWTAAAIPSAVFTGGSTQKFQVYKDGPGGLFTSGRAPSTFLGTGRCELRRATQSRPAVRKWEKPAAPTPRAAGFFFFGIDWERRVSAGSVCADTALAGLERFTLLLRDRSRPVTRRAADYDGWRGRARPPRISSRLLRRG